VAIGMYNITLKSEQWGLTNKGTAEKIKNILRKHQLPYELPEMDKEAVLKAIGVDKKNMDNKLRLCFIKTIGEGFIWDLEKERITELL
jgi:3-dehydroquinate synthase